jgi:hypothetical protein
MKPARIQVFDGLRLTTEHFDHLQSAMQSTVEDVREAVGLGVVYRGCQVSIADTTVTVQPGLAFDGQKGRLVLDEPKAATLDLAPGEDTRFVCLKYDQVWTDKVGDQFTLVFDSCLVELSPTLPSPLSGLLAIARIDRTRSGFNITLLNRAGSAQADRQADGTHAAAWVHQGVVELDPGEESGTDLAGLLLAPLRDSLAAQPSQTPNLRLALMQHAVALDFPFATLSSHVMLSATVNLPATSSSPASARTYGAVSHGEATWMGADVAQFGLGTELVHDGVASVPIGDVVEAEAAQRPSVHTLLSMARIVIGVAHATTLGFNLVVNLHWMGGIDEQGIAVLDATRPTLTWRAAVGFKAQGVAIACVTGAKG